MVLKIKIYNGFDVNVPKKQYILHNKTELLIEISHEKKS